MFEEIGSLRFYFCAPPDLQTLLIWPVNPLSTTLVYHLLYITMVCPTLHFSRIVNYNSSILDHINRLWARQCLSCRKASIWLAQESLASNSTKQSSHFKLEIPHLRREIPISNWDPTNRDAISYIRLISIAMLYPAQVSYKLRWHILHKIHINCDVISHKRAMKYPARERRNIPQKSDVTSRKNSTLDTMKNPVL